MKRPRHIPGLLLLSFALTACGNPSPTTPSPKTESASQWMMAHADDYLYDTTWRREELEASLWRPELPYASKRLSSYALEQGGWDLLPEMSADVEGIRGDGDSDLTGARYALTPTQTPTTAEEWRALGEEVFWRLPMRRDAYLEWLVTQPELWDEVGLEADSDGQLRGVVRFEDARGNVRSGLTCGLCHGANGQAGRAHRGMDLGRARGLFDEAQGRAPGAYASWGAGRVDITDDGVDDPLAIPDLWGTAHHDHLNSSGSIRHASPASLAIRLETQYTEGHSMETRPDRRLTWALAFFVLTLEPPAPSTPSDAALVERGAEVFARRCASCHDPARGYSGDLVEAELLTSDPRAAFSVKRGTSFYKVPSLIGVGEGGPYLHDGSQPNLPSLLSSGHPFGSTPPDDEISALTQFLVTL